MTQVVLCFNKGDKSAKVDLQGRDNDGKHIPLGGDFQVPPLGYADIIVHKKQAAHVSCREHTVVAFFNKAQQTVTLDVQDRAEDGTFKSNKASDVKLKPGCAIDITLSATQSVLVVSQD